MRSLLVYTHIYKNYRATRHHHRHHCTWPTQFIYVTRWVALCMILNNATKYGTHIHCIPIPRPSPSVCINQSISKSVTISFSFLIHRNCITGFNIYIILQCSKMEICNKSNNNITSICLGLIMIVKIMVSGVICDDEALSLSQLATCINSPVLVSCSSMSLSD